MRKPEISLQHILFCERKTSLKIKINCLTGNLLSRNILRKQEKICKRKSCVEFLLTRDYATKKYYIIKKRCKSGYPITLKTILTVFTATSSWLSFWRVPHRYIFTYIVLSQLLHRFSIVYFISARVQPMTRLVNVLLSVRNFINTVNKVRKTFITIWKRHATHGIIERYSRTRRSRSVIVFFL